MQIDATTLDVMAVMDDGVLDRPELVAAVDVATRCTAVLIPEKSKAVDAALLPARMMVPEPMRPVWEHLLRMSASRLPYARLVDIERTFESINTLFCQHVSGYTGRDVTRRSTDVADRAVWSIGELCALPARRRRTAKSAGRRTPAAGAQERP